MISTVLRLHAQSSTYLPRLAKGSVPFSFALISRVLEGVLLALMYLSIYPLFIRLFQKTLTPGDVMIFGGFLFTCAALRFVLFRFVGSEIYTYMHVSAGALRLRIVAHLRQLSLGLFQQDRLAQIKSILTEDIQMIGRMGGSLLTFYISALSIPVMIVIGLAFIDVRLALALCGSTVFCLPLLKLIGKFMHKHSHEHLNATSHASGRLLEYALGIQVLKSCGLTGEKFTQLHQALNDVRNSTKRMEMGLITILAISRIVVEMGIPALLIYGFTHLSGGDLNAIAFVFALILATRFYAPIHELMGLSSEVEYMKASLQRVESILALEKQDVGILIATEKNDITFENVTFSYNGRDTTLDTMSFTVPENTMTALVGPSGAGKTTVINLLTRFWDAQSGKVCIGGVNIRDMQMTELMQKISIVFQDVILFHDTVMENIRMAKPEASDEEVIAAAKQAQAHDFITAMPEAYGTMVGEGGGRLSGGEKQRISIARAFLKNAPIILLDEATAAIDPSHEKEIQQVFAELKKNKTVIAIAHKLSNIVYADQILVLDKGHIVQRGTHQELIQQAGLCELYKSLWSQS